ncbi:MAG: right-handed parallel beta-helix repeat-containing protein [Aquabacterium sp.]|nr:right-handed parallel beta-helix repeat-containing protein [Aquabacterium sp.]
MNRNAMRSQGLALALCLAVTPVMAAIDILVSPDDGLSGLTQALKQAREARLSNKAKPQAIRIVLKRGTYVLSAPWQITAADSGTTDAPLLIEPEAPGTVALTGGPAMSVSKRDSTRWYFAPPEGVDRIAERSGGQLYVNGNRAVLAREPNAGAWWFVQGASKDQLLMPPTDASKLKGLLEGQRERAIVHLMQSWTSGLHRVGKTTDDVSGSGRGIELLPAPKWPMLTFGSAQRYFVENLPGALDAPGEWLATNEHIVYIPRPEDTQASTAVWPRQPTLLTMRGDDNDGRRLSNVTIKGLKFAYTGAPTSIRGWVDGQGAISLPAAIEIENASNIILTQCDVRHTGGYGVWLKGNVINSEVSRCVMDDLGAGGIKIGLPTSNSAHPTGYNTVKGNVLMHTGRAFPGAIGIWVGRSGHNVLTDNVIGHTSYTGISVGWTWGYDEQGADGNQIKNNVLFNIGQGMLSDLGGIYTLGRGPGTVISGNLIRQVQDYPLYGAGAWGIYNDEGSSDILVDGNVVQGTRSGGYHLHYGRDNTVRNNLFADGGQAELRWSDPARSGDWLAQDNATSGQRAVGDIYLNGAPPETRVRMGIKAKAKDDGMTHVRVKSSADVADLSIQDGNGKLQAVWAATLDKARTTLRAAMAQPEVDKSLLTVPPASPTPTKPVLSWAWRFDQMPVGPVPMGLKFAPNKRAVPIVGVEPDPLRRGSGNCLLLTDGDAALARYEPYVFVPAERPLANTVVDFEVKLDAQSVLVHEWRDSAAHPYKTILKFTLSHQQGLQVAGKTLLPLPEGEWLRVKVQTHAGPQKSWSLDVRTASAAKGHWDDLPLSTALLPQIGWVGWISDTAMVSQTCLKSLSIHPL